MRTLIFLIGVAAIIPTIVTILAALYMFEVITNNDNDK